MPDATTQYGVPRDTSAEMELRRHVAAVVDRHGAFDVVTVDPPTKTDVVELFSQ